MSEISFTSTKAMRQRLRELSRPDECDYDRAVIALLDDFEALLKLSKVFPSGMLRAESESMGASGAIHYRGGRLP